MPILASRQIPSLAPGTPALPPPPGVTPNFTAPEEPEQRILQVNIACIILAVIFITLRMYTRVKISRVVGIDDYTSIVALVFILGFSGMALQCRALGMGRHLWDVESSTFYEGRFFMVDTVAECFYYAAIFFLKTSILLLYRRIFSTNRKLEIAIYVFIAVLFIYNSLGMLLNLLACTPTGDTWAYWVVNIDFSVMCMDIWHINMGMRILNVITDILIVVIPVPIILRLQMPTQQRLVILGVLLTSLLAVVASLVTLYYTIVQGNYIPDFTWHFSDVILWLTIELYIGFFCSCMPALKQLWQFLSPRLLKSGASKSSPKKGSNSVINSFWFHQIRRSKKRSGDEDGLTTTPQMSDAQDTRLTKGGALEEALERSESEDQGQGQGVGVDRAHEHRLADSTDGAGAGVKTQRFDFEYEPKEKVVMPAQ